MNPEAEKRRKLAGRLTKQIKDAVTIGVILVGSTAYATNAVTRESDLDLIAVTEFKRTNFEDLYKAIGHPYEPELAEYARQESFDNFTIVWDEGQIEVQLHVWGIESFVGAVNLETYQRRFARNQYHKQLNSARPHEVIFNLRGEKKTLERTPIAELSGGKIIPLYICYEDKSGIYLGVPATNLLLEPKVLSQDQDYLSGGLRYFRAVLAKKIAAQLRKNPKNKISLFNALPAKIKNKTGPDLKKKLEDFLKNPNT